MGAEMEPRGGMPAPMRRGGGRGGGRGRCRGKDRGEGRV